MSERFSASLRISDLNDFIAPSQGCVVSLKGESRPRAGPHRTENHVKALDTSKATNTEPVKISLKDCLACRLTNVDKNGNLFSVRGGSGGYAETIFRYAAKELFGKEIQGPLDFKALRNSDFRDYSGGQIKPEKGQSAKELIRSLEELYTEEVVVANPSDNPAVKNLYEEWLGQLGSDKAKKYLYTHYHPVIKSVNSQLQNW